MKLLGEMFIITLVLLVLYLFGGVIWYHFIGEQHVKWRSATDAYGCYHEVREVNYLAIDVTGEYFVCE